MEDFLDLETRKSLDKFYTNKDIFLPIFEEFFKKGFQKKYSKYVFIEPASGNGSLVDILTEKKFSNILAFDLYPEREDIVEQDFFELNIKKYTKSKNIITFMNPPFGKCCSMAIKFFNKSSIFSKEIWQIVPKTFKKKSVQDKLNVNFHLVFEKDLPKNSFILDDNIYDVPCCFQVWVQKEESRKIIKNKTTSKYFKFVDKDDATHAIRRVGGKSGQLLEGLKHSKSSTYFIKVLDNNILQILPNIEIKNIINSTAGVRSISKHELINCIETEMKKLNKKDANVKRKICLFY